MQENTATRAGFEFKRGDAVGLAARGLSHSTIYSMPTQCVGPGANRHQAFALRAKSGNVMLIQSNVDAPPLGLDPWPLG